MSNIVAAKYLRKSKQFEQKWVSRHEETETVDDRLEHGLTRASSFQEDKTILGMFKKNSFLTLRQSQKKRAKKGLKIGLMTIKRPLNEANFSW